MWLVRSIAVVVTVLLAISSHAFARDTIDQEEILSNAGFTLQRMEDDPNMAAARTLMQRARAVIVFPRLIKGAFFIGGEGGTGVLLVRRPDNTWSYPAFYTLGSISFGLQIGGESSQAILLVMNDKALNALMSDQVKLGGDLSAAVGPVGTGVAAAATTSFGEDIYTYSTNEGLFLGASLEGGVIARREDMNGGFYGGVTSPKTITEENSVSNPAADPLRALLQHYGTPTATPSPTPPATSGSATQ
jgi:SH3 domain-containing YSC84-like protein 1